MNTSIEIVDMMYGMSNNKLTKLKKELKLVDDEKKRKQELYDAKEWYTIRALLGNQWANWFIMAGARER